MILHDITYYILYLHWFQIITLGPEDFTLSIFFGGISMYMSLMTYLEWIVMLWWSLG